MDIDALLLQADEHLKSGRYQAAFDLYQQIVSDQSAPIEAWVGLAMAHYRLGQFSNAAQTAMQVLARDQQQIRAGLVASAALIELGNYGEAISMADLALAIEADNRFALSSKLRALLALGRYAEAVTTAQSLSKIEPTNPAIYLSLGNALQGMGQPALALDAFDQALAINPRFDLALMNRSSVLLQLNRPDEALCAADAALQIQPDSAIALLNRAAALLSLRQYRESLATIDALLNQHPRHIKGLINKTLALLALWDFREALNATLKVLTFDSFNPEAIELKLKALAGLNRFADVVAEGLKALSKYPQRMELKLTVAKALIKLRHFTEAQSNIDVVLRTNPNDAEALSLKAEILLVTGRADAGHTLIDQALAANPNPAPLWTLKSTALLDAGRFAEALAAAQQALKAEPDYVHAAINQIAALNSLNRFADSIPLIQQLLDRGVRNWQLYANQGGALVALERFDEARRAYDAARDLDHQAFQVFRMRDQIFGVPVDALIPELDPRAGYVTLQLARLERADWNQYGAALQKATVLIAQCLEQGQLAPLQPFKSLLLPLPPDQIAAIARSRGQFFASGMASARQSLAFAEQKLADGRIKIGYVSADFGEHPTSHLMRSLFRTHDRAYFETYVYALCSDNQSGYYQQIKADADQFISLIDLSNAEAASRIHADGIHVLIDLMGYTTYARTEIFALQPAPVQASYLGYPGSLGAPFIPYIIADPVVLPENNLRYFSECPVYLPECYQVNDRWQSIAETGVTRADQGLPESAFVFCCFNQIQKIEPVIFAVWMRILSQVPESVLWLYSKREDVRHHLQATALTHGIAGERLIFAERLPKDQHLERHKLADLFLDTRIYNAHTTASDALWAGLPVLTCMGDAFPARVAASLLHAVGLPELITHSLQEYEQCAIRLATQPTQLMELKQKLAANRLQTPLFDTERFTRHLERAYAMMWERHAQGLPPAPLRVEPLPGHG